jgi:PKD domain
MTPASLLPSLRSRTAPGRLRRTLGALAAVLALLAAPAAAQAVTWIDGPAFDTGRVPLNGRLAGGPGGSVTQAWLQNTGFEDPSSGVLSLSVRMQRAAADGTVGSVLELDATDPDDADNPLEGSVAVATGAGGTTAVAWTLSTASGEYRVGVAFFDAAGAYAGGDRAVATLSRRSGLSVAVDGNGVATLAYKDEDPGAGTVATVARVTPGSLRTTVLGSVPEDAALTVAAAANGVVWLAWGDQDGSTVARFAADGSLDGAPQIIGVDASGVTLAVAPDGSRAAVAGVEKATATVVGARLATSGRLIAGRFATVSTVTPDPLDETTPYLPALAAGSDGTVTVAQTLSTGSFATSVEYVRIPPGAVNGTPQAIADPADGYAATPALAARADGTLLAAWLNLRITDPMRPTVLTRLVAPDGTLGPRLNAGTAALVFSSIEQNAVGTALAPFLPSGGDALLGLPQGIGMGSMVSYSLRLLDLVPPAVDASVPAAGVVGRPVPFSATATDRHGEVSLRWSFGDRSGADGASVSHTYGEPGIFAVKLTATDRAGNETVVDRQLTIATADGPPPRDRAPPRGGARLKILRATRRGSHVAVSGTIAKSAGGAVTVAYGQRFGRATVTSRKRARIAGGRWSVTVRLPARLARAAGRATVVVTYAGDAGIREGRATRAVVTARPKPRKPRRGR